MDLEALPHKAPGGQLGDASSPEDRYLAGGLQVETEHVEGGVGLVRLNHDDDVIAGEKPRAATGNDRLAIANDGRNDP